jgi:hypothetical protein
VSGESYEILQDDTVPFRGQHIERMFGEKKGEFCDDFAKDKIKHMVSKSAQTNAKRDRDQILEKRRSRIILGSGSLTKPILSNLPVTDKDRLVCDNRRLHTVLGKTGLPSVLDGGLFFRVGIISLEASCNFSKGYYKNKLEPLGKFEDTIMQAEKDQLLIVENKPVGMDKVATNHIIQQMMDVSPQVSNVAEKCGTSLYGKCHCQVVVVLEGEDEEMPCYFHAVDESGFTRYYKKIKYFRREHTRAVQSFTAYLSLDVVDRMIDFDGVEIDVNSKKTDGTIKNYLLKVSYGCLCTDASMKKSAKWFHCFVVHNVNDGVGTLLLEKDLDSRLKDGLRNLTYTCRASKTPVDHRGLWYAGDTNYSQFIVSDQSLPVQGGYFMLQGDQKVSTATQASSSAKPLSKFMQGHFLENDLSQFAIFPMRPTSCNIVPMNLEKQKASVDHPSFIMTTYHVNTVLAPRVKGP